ncbi:MAG: TetR/AcrR family transcriptional regulator [Coprococcus sp.]
MRVVKEHDERKNEIIDTAARLFASKGYAQCSVNDILNDIGIAKGTFYHYFKSKEDVLDAVICKTSDRIAEKVKEVASDANSTPEEKILYVFLSARADEKTDEAIIEEMHKPENALMHQKTLVSVINILTPVLTQIVDEGIQMGVFECAYPEQYMQIFLAASSTLLDDGIFRVEPEKAQKIFNAMIMMLEKMLGIEEGRFLEVAKKYWSF